MSTAERLAPEVELRLEVVVELRRAGDVHALGRDLGVDLEQLPLHALVPDQPVVVGHEDAAARGQVVPGEDEARGGDPHAVRHLERQLAGDAVDVRAVEDQVGLDAIEKRLELRVSEVRSEARCSRRVKARSAGRQASARAEALTSAAAGACPAPPHAGRAAPSCSSPPRTTANGRGRSRSAPAAATPTARADSGAAG